MTHAIDMQRLYDALEGASVWMGNHLLHLEERSRRYNPRASLAYRVLQDREIDDLRADLLEIEALRDQVRSMKETA